MTKISTVSAFRLLALLSLLWATGCGSSNPVTRATVTPVTLATSTLPYAVAGVPFSTVLRATNGSQPYTFSYAGGQLPAGMTVSANGILAGTPTLPGAYPIMIKVADAQTPASVDTETLAFDVAPKLLIPVVSLPDAQVAAPYNDALIAGGIAPYTYAYGGVLPAGLTLTSNGVLTGTPVAAGGLVLPLTVRDVSGQTVSVTLLLTIDPVPLALNLPPSVASVNAAYTLMMMPTGGTPPYLFSLSSSALPAGLTLSSGGTLSGTLTASGLYSPVFKVQDSAVPAQTIYATLSLSVITGVVTVEPDAALAVVPQTAFGMHTSVYDSSLSDVTALPSLLATAGIRVLRYPGGSYSDNYHWAQYTMTPFVASTAPACDVIPSGYLAPQSDFGSFVRTLAATGTQAIITVNYGTSVANAAGTRSASAYGPNTCSEPNTSGQPQEAAAWVAYANGDPANTQSIGMDAAGFDWKTVGFWAGLRAAQPVLVDDGYNFLRIGVVAPVGIRYWEIGNEIYYNGYNSNNNAESDNHAPYVYPSGYAGTYSSRSNVDALSPTSYGTNAAAYMRAMRAVDPTIQVGVVVASAIDPIPSSWTQAVLNAVCASAVPDFAILHYYPGTYNDTTAAQLLFNPQADMPNLVAGIKRNLQAFCPASAAATQIFVTETNPDGALDPAVPAVVPGLYAAHEMLTALEQGVANIEWLELHGGAGTFLTPGTEAPGPAFYGIELAHLLVSPGDTLVQSASSSGTLLSHAGHRADGGNALLLINADPLAAATIQVSLPGVAAGTVATQYSFGMTTTQAGPALAGSSVVLPGATFFVTVAPYTAVEIEVP